MNFSLNRVFFILLFSVSALYAQDKYAVIVGNSNYTNITDLPIVKNDTIDVSNKFKDLGFKVSTLLDPSKEDIFGYINNLKYSISQDSTVIFYYAGHGVQIDSKDYIVTKDITGEISSLEQNSVSVSWIMGSLYKSKASTILIFMDACRNNPYPSKNSKREMKVVTKDVKTKDEGRSKQIGIIYSTNSGETAYDSVRGFKNSPFTTAFLNNISTPNVSIDTILNRISNDVGLYTKGSQEIDSKIDFKKKLVLNTNSDHKITIRDSYNSLIVNGYGLLRIVANDNCLVIINSNSEFFFQKGEEKSFDYEVGRHTVRLSGYNKSEEIKVRVNEASTTQVFFNDYNYVNEDEYIKLKNLSNPVEQTPEKTNSNSYFYVSAFKDKGLKVPTGGFWQVETDKSNGGKSTAKINTSTLEKGYIHMVYSLDKNKKLGYRYAQLQALFSTPQDFTYYTGIEIKVRGNGQDFRVQLASASVKDYGFHESPTEKAVEDWRTIYISFDSLSQPNWAVRKKIDMENINSLQVQILGEEAVENNFIEIEYIRAIY